jgi:hypothetical protein
MTLFYVTKALLYVFPILRDYGFHTETKICGNQKHINLFGIVVISFFLIPVCAFERNVIRKEGKKVSKEFQEYYSYNKNQRDALFIRFVWYGTLHVSDTFTVHHQEF